MAEEFIKGTEYMVAKHQGPREYTVAIFASGHGDGELINVVEHEYDFKRDAIAAMKKLLKTFPDIEITYLDADGSDTNPWFADENYR